MYFFLAYMTTITGVVLSGICGLIPSYSQFSVPDPIRGLFFMVGIFIALFGLILLQMRAQKVGANHLIAPGRPDNILWFYVYRDGAIKITPSMRDVEGQLYSKELDAQVSDFKSYRIFDHSIRFIPEGIGSSIDLDLCLYAYVLKTKYGFSNILQARKAWFGKIGTSEKMQSQEHIITGKEINQIPTRPQPDMKLQSEE